MRINLYLILQKNETSTQSGAGKKMVNPLVEKAKIQTVQNFINTSLASKEKSEDVKAYYLA